MLSFIIKSMVVAFALALLAYSVFPELGLLRPIAASLAISLLFSFAYPYIRGVKRGDGLISIQASPGPLFIFGASTCLAMEDGRKGDQIPITFNDGTLGYGVIEAYEGLITPARIRILHKPTAMHEMTAI